ncbi:MAG: F0F1 ATP synthase subunit B [Pirellulaceae bacterium]|nr:F0F1 ATP synthase subunit B [Pirellulaceae bacterium]
MLAFALAIPLAYGDDEDAKAGGSDAAHEGADEASGGGGDSSGGHEANGHEAEGGEGAAGGDHHDPHDPHDLSHSNATASLNASEEFKGDLAIFTLVVFLLLLAVLMKFAWGPIVAGLGKREEGIANNIRRAEENAAKSAALLTEHEAKLAATAEEGRVMIEKAKADAERAGAKIVADAEAAAERERQRALNDIEAAKNTALSEVAERGVDVAVGLAGQLVQKELRAADHEGLIRDALNQFPSNN